MSIGTGVNVIAWLGRCRWFVERTLGWLLSYERLTLRCDSSAVAITALVRLAVILVCAGGCMRADATTS